MSKINIVWGVLLSAILILAFGVSTTTAQEIKNLLKNPDFEVDAANWTIGAGGTWSIDKKEKFPVGQVVKAQIDNPGADDWVPETHSNMFDVKNATVYTCSFWAKSDADVRPIGVKFEQDQTWTGPSQTFNLNMEMKEYNFSPTMTMGSPPQVVIHIQYNKIKGSVWFAHFRVYEGKYVKDNIDLNAKPKAVNPGEKLASSWGSIKSR
jgi:hypothetical protein